MPHVFIDNTYFSPREVVFDLAHDSERKRSSVRLEISWAYIADVWGLHWYRDRDAIIARFDAEKHAFLARMEAVATNDRNQTVCLAILLG